MEGKNAAYTRLYNRRRVLGLLQRQPTSRAELARTMGLTRAAISLIADELIGEGVIRESSMQPESVGPGRTPTILKLCKNAFFALGVSLRRSGCKVGLEDMAGGLLACQDVPLSPQMNSEKRVTQIAETIRSMVKKAGIPSHKILGIGIAAPGPVDQSGGRVLNPPNFPGWENCPVASLLEAQLGIPAYLENDACASALYNCIAHDFPERDHFALIFVDCGVGSGIVCNGKILRSSDGFTCELGHTSIDFHGPVCSCGNRGCLEQYASLDRLAAHFGMDSFEALMASSHRDAALELEADYLAAGIVNLCNMVRPEAILLGGRLQDYSQALLPRLERRIQGRTLGQTPPRLLSALSGADTFVKSACSIAFGRFLEIG